MTDGLEKKAEIREQIEYDILCQQYDRMQLDELVEIMLEVALNRSPTVKIGRDAEYPTGFVQQRFEKNGPSWTCAFPMHRKRTAA